MKKLTQRVTLVASLLAIVTSAALAQAPATISSAQQQLLQHYVEDSLSETQGFKPSATRGGEFYARRFAYSNVMPSCTTCHGEKPTQSGKHGVTGKLIQPLSPRVNPERLTDLAKTEKWFKRNCKEVIGRMCTPAEKADFVQFLLQAG